MIDTENPVEIFNLSNNDIDDDGNVKLIWNTYDERMSEKLVGDYIITATLNYNTTIQLEENVKRFSIRDIGQVSGCTDPNSINYNLFAELDDGSCKYQQDCNEKYNVSEFVTDVVVLYEGYNTLSLMMLFIQQLIWVVSGYHLPIEVLV